MSEEAPDMVNTDNEVSDKNTGVTLFGRQLEDIPCFRESFLRGIGGGLALGIGHFMFTSKVKRSTDVAVYSFATITLLQWFYCRYMDSVRRFDAQKLAYAMEIRRANIGTERDKPSQDV